MWRDHDVNVVIHDYDGVKSEVMTIIVTHDGEYPVALPGKEGSLFAVQPPGHKVRRPIHPPMRQPPAIDPKPHGVNVEALNQGG